MNDNITNKKKELWQRKILQPNDEYNAMIENLKKYFAKGEELADLLEQQKKNGLGF